jgi:hypothetical protein
LARITMRVTIADPHSRFLAASSRCPVQARSRGKRY